MTEPVERPADVPLRAVALALATSETSVHQEGPYTNGCPQCEAAKELREMLTAEQWEALWD